MTRFTLFALSAAAFTMAPDSLFAHAPAAVAHVRDALSGDIGNAAAVVALTLGAAELAAAWLFPGRNL